MTLGSGNIKAAFQNEDNLPVKNLCECSKKYVTNLPSPISPGKYKNSNPITLKQNVISPITKTMNIINIPFF
jgi:hypothetical protein